MPRAFEKAVYSGNRKKDHSLLEYTMVSTTKLNKLKREGVDLPHAAKGYIMHLNATLSEAQENIVKACALGKFELNAIITAVRNLDNVYAEHGTSGNCLPAGGGGGRRALSGGKQSGVRSRSGHGLRARTRHEERFRGVGADDGAGAIHSDSGVSPLREGQARLLQQIRRQANLEVQTRGPRSTRERAASESPISMC